IQTTKIVTVYFINCEWDRLYFTKTIQKRKHEEVLSSPRLPILLL
ncbi:20315_t:CDS:1, partial [Gigaspora rosea]